MLKRITINKVQSGINNTTDDVNKIGALLMFNDVLPKNWLPDVADWITATAYVIGDKVYDTVSKNYYVANADHTSGTTFATDIANWNIDIKTVKRFRTLIDVQNAGLIKDDVDMKLQSYQASDTYRINKNAVLDVYIVNETGQTWDFVELIEFVMQMDTASKATGIGIYGNFPMVESVFTNITTQLKYIKDNYSIDIPAVYVSGNYDTFTDTDSLIAVDNTTYASPKVMEITAQDGDAYGYSLQTTNLGAVGAVVGVHTLSGVQNSVGRYAYVLSDNLELRKPILPFGQIE